MLGLDTNVIARIVLADDPKQTQAALNRLAQAQQAGETVMLGLPTLLELEWVLRSRAKLSKPQVLRVFKRLLETKDLHIEGEQVLEQALVAWENANADFAECLFCASYMRSGCRSMLTFDKAASALHGAELIDG